MTPELFWLIFVCVAFALYLTAQVAYTIGKDSGWTAGWNDANRLHDARHR